MENQIIAISYGPTEDKLTRKSILNYFKHTGFEMQDESNSLMSDGKTNFVCSIFEKTGYLMFKEVNGCELPAPVFDYIFTLRDDTTIISLGVETPDTWESIQTDSEYSLKRFKSIWNEDV